MHFRALFALALVLSGCPLDDPKPPPDTPPPPSGQKLAFVFADNGDHWFNNEATAMAQQLRARGWTTHLTGELDNQARPIDALLAAVATAQKNDRVLIDVQTHGGDVYAHLTNAAGQPEWTSFGFGARLSAFNPGAYYPTSRDLFATHAMGVYDARSDVGDWLYPSSFAPAIATLLAKGANVAIFDHSCNAGATLQYYASQHPNVCVVATAGAMGPSLTGWPALSSVLRSTQNGEQAAKWLSATIYRDQHHQGGRLHQLGFATGCQETMPLREMLDASTYAFGTWWHWNRLDAAHVIREPARYTTATEAQDPTQPGWHPDTATADGWLVWLMDGLANVELNATTMTAAEKATLRTQVTALRDEAAQYKARLAVLRARLQVEVIKYDGGFFSLDTFLREAITGQCICAATTGDGFWADFVAHKDCAGRLARPASSSLVQARPALNPTPALCANPRAYVDQVLAAAPSVKTAYESVLEAAARTRDAGIAASLTLEISERRCVSAPCAAFAL